MNVFHPFRRCAGAILVGLLWMGSSAAAAQDSSDPCPPTCTWEALVNYSYSSVTGGRAPWHEVRAGVVHSFGSGWTAALEVIDGSRFGRWDQSVALDSYAELWADSYANLRVQYAPAPDFMPVAEAYGELFQGLPMGWEVSGNYRIRAYPDDKIHQMGLSVGRYLGSWYLRAIGRMLPRAGELGVVYVAEARYYLEPPRSYVKVEAGRGRGVEVIDVGPVIQLTTTYHVSLRLQTFFSDHVGIAVQGTYSNDDFFRRSTGTLGLMTRW